MNDWEQRLSIIILNYNNTDLTIENVKRIRELSKKIHIVLIDNCSTDDSHKALEKYIFNKDNIHYIASNKNEGYAIGNNIGLKYVSLHLKEVDTVCVMNPDIVVGSLSDFCDLYNALWKDNQLAAITAQTIYNGKIRQPNDFGWKKLNRKHMMFGGTFLGRVIKSNIRYKILDVNENMVAYADIIQGCFFMAKLKLMERIDFFDEGTFLYEEEAILGRKIEKIGYKEGVLTTTYIQHNHHQKEKSLVKKQNKLFDMNCFYNSRKYYIKNYSDESNSFIIIACAYLNLDYFLKKIFISITKK